MADWFLNATQSDVISIGVRLILQAVMIVKRLETLYDPVARVHCVHSVARGV